MGWRTAVRRGLEWAGRQFDRSSSSLSYAAAATLSLRDLQAAIAAQWNEFGATPDEIDAGFMRWELELVAAAVRPSDHVLVVGCGAGRDVLAFAALGCGVTGVDPAPVAVAAARRLLAERHVDARVVDGFFEDADVGGPFDVVSFSYYSYSYIPLARRRIAALRKAASLLSPGGRILVSCNPGPPVDPRLVRMGRLWSALSRSDWRPEDGDLFLRGGPSGFRYLHTFRPGEVEREIEAAGLEITFSSTREKAFVLTPRALPPAA